MSDTRIMGVLNVTPDSFSDGGRFAATEVAIARGRDLFGQGADIVDVGGESTRPGATPVPSDEEQRRVLPVIRALAADGFQTSIDTIHADTARAAIEAGATCINDVSGGTHDPAMLDAAAWAGAERAALFVIGHWRGVPDASHRRSDYADVVAEVRDALAAQADAALRAGVGQERIVLDPGLGFDKTGDQSWRLLAHLEALTALGYPVLIGASRKRMISEALASPWGAGMTRNTPEQRDLATSVVSALAARAGAWGVRVHDVAGTVQALAVVRFWDAQRGAAAPAGSAAAPAGSAAAPAGSAAATSPSSSPLSSAAVDMRSAGDMAKEAGSAISAADPISPADGGIGSECESAAPRDRIALTGLEVFAHHGVFDFERERGQRFLIDVELAVDLSPAASGDDLGSTVHYGVLAEAIVAAVERDPVDLIETVAERVAAVSLGFAGVAEVRATVHKPDAPIEAPFADVSVSVIRSATNGANA